MTPEGFVDEFKNLQELLLKGYFTEDSDISRIDMLQKAGLNQTQIDIIQSIVSDALTDSLYTVLLGLDGCATIGKNQESYILKGEKGNQISGELESYAWEQFQQ